MNGIANKQANQTISSIFCIIVLIVLSACSITDDQPAPPLEVEVVGHDHHWLTRYPGPDGLLGTADDVGSKDVVRLPGETEVRLTLSSADYAYIFRVQELGLNELAALVHTSEVTIHTGEPIAFKLEGDVVCGFPDPNLVSEILIEERAEFTSWLSTLEPWQDPPLQPSAVRATGG